LQVEWALPIWGWPVLAVAALAAVIWSRWQYMRTQPAVGGSLRGWLIFLRSSALVFLLLAMAGPSLFRVRSQARPAELVVLVEDSASMALPLGATGKSRWEQGLELAMAIDSLVQMLPVTVHVQFLRGNGVVPVQDLDPEPASPPVAVGSDHQALLRDIGSRWAERPLRGIVLLSDGNDTSPAAVRGGSSFNLGAAELLAVGLGDPAGPPDRAIQDLRYPEVAFQGDEVVVEVTLAERSSDVNAESTITLVLREGTEVLAQTAVESTPDGIARAELAFLPADPGLHALELEVLPLANERYLSNNKATLAISVQKERARILLLTGSPGWDTRFLAQAAEQEERLQLEIGYPGPEGPVLADSLGTWQLPQDAVTWQQWDAVVLQGWESFRRDLDWAGLQAAVAAGMGLIVMVNDAETPEVLRRSVTLLMPPADLADMLPVALSAGRWVSGEWVLRATPRSGRHSLLEGVTFNSLTGREQSLADLPPLVSLVEAVPRPGGNTLLVAQPRLTREPEQTLPVLVVGQHQAGQVVWFGGRRLWELAFWEAPAGKTAAPLQPARRLLRNLLVWVVAGDETSGLNMVGHRKVFQEGERIRLEAQWRAGRDDSLAGRPVVLRLLPLDSEAAISERLFSMEAVPDEAGRSTVVLPFLPPGRYTVRPEAGSGPALSGRESHFVVSPISLEAAQVRQDRRFLRQLVSQWGGQYIAGESEAALGRLAQALGVLDLDGDVHVTRQRWNIWAGWPFLVLFVSFLGVEWALRRRQGLL